MLSTFVTIKMLAVFLFSMKSSCYGLNSAHISTSGEPGFINIDNFEGSSTCNNFIRKYTAGEDMYSNGICVNRLTLKL